MNDRRTHGGGIQPGETFGIVLLLISAMAFSAAGFFTRMAPVAPSAMIFWRNLFGCLGMTVFAVIARSRPAADLRCLTRAGWAAALISAASMTCYLSAFAYTSVANISIIYATAPMITAVLAWIGLGERLARQTAMAACLAVVGVVITTAGSAYSVSVLGDGLALLMTAGLSIVAVLTRRGGVPPWPTALAAAGLAAVIAVPFAAVSGTGLQIGLREAAWLAGFGIVTITLAWPLSLAAMARVPAARAMLISAFELPLAPLWVWLAVGEVPSRAAMVGGTLVFLAVLCEVTSPSVRRSAVALPIRGQANQQKRGAAAPLE